MKYVNESFTVKTSKRLEIIDITNNVKRRRNINRF